MHPSEEFAKRCQRSPLLWPHSFICVSVSGAAPMSSLHTQTHLPWGFVCLMCTALSGGNLFHWQLTFGVCGHPSHNSAQKPHIGLGYRMITAIISLYSDSLNYGYEEQPSSLLMTDLLKASFQQACTRNPFKVLSIKPLNWSLKLFLQTVTRELLVSPFSVVSPVLHYSLQFQGARLDISFCPLLRISGVCEKQKA